MGKPNMGRPYYLAQARGKPGEVKHLSNQRKRNRIDTVSSGERKRQSLNHVLRTQVESFRHGRIRLRRKKFIKFIK